MADVVDMAAEIEAEHLASALRRAIAPIPTGVAGICDNCGDDMPRLVDGLCGYCRDGRRPPLNHSPAPRSAPPAPVIRKEPEPMPAKSIQLPASAEAAIAAVENYAKRHVVSLGHAAAELIDRGLAAKTAPPAAPIVGIDPASLPPIALALLEHDFSIDALLAQLLAAPVGPDLSGDLAAANARADAAEGRLAKLREALAA